MQRCIRRSVGHIRLYAPSFSSRAPRLRKKSLRLPGQSCALHLTKKILYRVLNTAKNNVKRVVYASLTRV